MFTTRLPRGVTSKEHASRHHRRLPQRRLKFEPLEQRRLLATTLNIDNPIVDVDEGQIAVNTGSFLDTNNDAVNVTASIGQITQDPGDGDLVWNRTLDSSGWGDGWLTTYPALAGDVNGDGLTDMIWRNSTGEKVLTSISLGNGSWSRTVDETTGRWGGWFEHPALTGDVNGDGNMDMLLLNDDPGNGFGGAVQVLTALADGNGGWTTVSHNTGLDSIWIDQYENCVPLIGDVDGNGRADLILRSYQMTGTPEDPQYRTHVLTLLSQVDGGWASETQTFGWGNGWFMQHPALTGDFNGDGRTDFTVSIDPGSSYDGTVQALTFISQGNGQWNSIRRSTGLDTIWIDSYPALAGDLNADGRTDLVLRRYDSGVQIRTLLSDGDYSQGTGDWAQSQHSSTWDNDWLDQYPAVMGDVDADGDDDMILRAYSGDNVQVLTFLAQDDGTWTTSKHPTSWSGDWLDAYPSSYTGSIHGDGATPPVLAGDVNGDGTTDLIFRFREDVPNGFQTHTAFSERGLWHAEYMANGWGNGWVDSYPALTGDINSDGLTDMVMRNGDGTKVLAAISQGDGTWATSQDLSAVWAQASDRMAVNGDVNGDGNMDMLLFDDRADNGFGGAIQLITALADGNGGWSTGSYNTGLDSIWIDQYENCVPLIGDVDADGRDDLILRSYQETDTPDGLKYRIHVLSLRYQDDGTWDSDMQIFGWGNGWLSGYPALTGDVDGDGDTDMMMLTDSPSYDDIVHVLTFLSDGNGGWRTVRHNTGLESRWLSLYANCVPLTGDVNADGRTDMILRSYDPVEGTQITTLFSTGDFAQSDDDTWTQYYQRFGWGNGWFSRYPGMAGDVDADGDCDLVVRSYENGVKMLTFFWQEDSGSWVSTLQRYGWGQRYLDNYPALGGDFDGDGGFDFILRDYATSGGVQTLLHTSQRGTWAWSFDTAGWMEPSQTVTITATDIPGNFDSGSFELVGAPLVEFSATTFSDEENSGVLVDLTRTGDLSRPTSVRIEFGSGSGDRRQRL